MTDGGSAGTAGAGFRADSPEPLAGPPVHTACDKWIAIERGTHGTRVIVTEPARSVSPERSMWANLSPRDVGELIDALLAACPRGASFAAALTDGTPR